MDITLLRKIPFDVIINHILPYTYEKQPTLLMCDIRSFFEDYRIIANYYYYELNEYILLRDIVYFYNGGHQIDAGIEQSFVNRLNRNIILQKKTLEHKYVFIVLRYHENIIVNADKKIKFLWALLKPRERTSFINKYILH
jgi:hypothetical protein